MLGKFFLSVKWITTAATIVTDAVTDAMIRAARGRSAAFATGRSLRAGAPAGARPRSPRMWTCHDLLTIG